MICSSVIPSASSQDQLDSNSRSFNHRLAEHDFRLYCDAFVRHRPGLRAEKKAWHRKPSKKTAISRRGDNIWYKHNGKWRVVRDAFHDVSNRDHDIGGKNALIATEFFYFGRDAIPVLAEFLPLLAPTQGHKNTVDAKTIDRFWKWVKRKAPKPGRIGDPFEFTDDACGAQRGEIQEDDIEC